YNYQKVMISYIKDSLNWNRQLIGINIKPPAAEREINNSPDNSISIPGVDVIGFNSYYTAPNELLKADDNSMYLWNVEKIWTERDNKGLLRVPLIISEGGIDNAYSPCSNYNLRPVDEMTLGFTGIAGFLFWDGRGKNVDSINNLYLNLWKNTFRALNHMNGDDVIGTLSQGGGYWEHGAQETKIKISTGPFKKDDKPFLLEQQNYVSNDKSKFVGYVRNRTYNIRTKGCINATFPDLEDSTHFFNLYSITWDKPPVGERLKVKNLQSGKYYSVHWYSFKDGNYIKTDCLKAKSGKIRLEFPTLTTSTPGNPVLWFVAERSDCNKNKSPINDYSTASLFKQEDDLLKNTIYPNPFEDFFIINSLEEDVFILQSMDGTIIGNYKVSKGETKITENLSKGIYIGKLINQSQTFKLIKL
ncbi:MAG: T9SS type A sorting domain-containing protein, partial [Brumimicrobium sp.]|nr:T9SS type A sorting domain-containing protein [Brumimicrobium sp.]